MGIFDFFNKKSPELALVEQRRRIVTELKEAEGNFLKHRIDKNTFDSISRERNSDLIRIEAEIDSQKHKSLNSNELLLAKSISSDKRKIISGLLEEKQKKVYELKLAESGYLKRRISEEVYQKISSEVKREIIAVDSQVKAILESEEISRLKDSLKSGAAEILRQQKLSDERKKQDYREEMEEDIFEQAKDMPNVSIDGELEDVNPDNAGVKEGISSASSRVEHEPIFEEDNKIENEKNIPKKVKEAIIPMELIAENN